MMSKRNLVPVTIRNIVPFGKLGTGGLEAYELMRGVGNLCIGADHDPHYDARRLIELLIAGLRRPHQLSARQPRKTGACLS
jgi:hypothetical protein